jgi:hypothetical protein
MSGADPKAMPVSYQYDPAQRPPPPAGYPPQYGSPPPAPYGSPPPPPYGGPPPPGWPPQAPAPWPYAPPAGFGHPPAGPRPAGGVPAYIAAALFVVCAVQSLIYAIVSWDGSGSPEVMAAVIGIVYSGRITGNIDFGISMTMSVACTTATFAAILFARLAFARWLLAGLGGAVVAYYAVAVIFLVVRDAAGFVGLPLLALLTWAAATVVALLPATARAMRRPPWSR